MPQQMTVTRNPDGSHWPPYEADWPEQLQVEYAAGCTASDTGLRIDVRPTVGTTPQKYHLRLRNGRSSVGGAVLTALEAYVYLDGVRQALTVIGVALPLGASSSQG